MMKQRRESNNSMYLPQLLGRRIYRTDTDGGGVIFKNYHEQSTLELLLDG